MIIRIYEKGATVTFSDREAEEKIDYGNIDPADKSFSGLSPEEYDEAVRRKIARFAVMSNTSESMETAGPGFRDEMERIIKETDNKTEYAAGDTGGELLKEVVTDLHQIIIRATDFYKKNFYDFRTVSELYR